MRVLHLVKTGMGATWAVRQVRELVALGIDVHVAVPVGPRTQDYQRVGAAVHVLDTGLPVRQPGRWPASRQALRSLVRDVQPDLLHSHFVSTTLGARAALGRDHPVPRLFNVPGPLHLEHAVTRRAEIRSAGRRDSWIAGCRWTQQAYLDQGIAADRVHLAYYGVEFAGLTGEPTRRQLGLPPDGPIVGMVAHMYAPKRLLGQRKGLKGHEDLVDAMVVVRAQQPSARVVFVGAAWAGAHWYERRIRDYAHRRLGEGAVFLGNRSDVGDLYRHFDVAVHPSHSENLGGAAESLLLGVPTVTTSVGGFPDLITDGVTGLLAPPRAPTALADAVLRSLHQRESAKAMARAGQQHTRALLEPAHNARVVQRAYRATLEAVRAG